MSEAGQLALFWGFSPVAAAVCGGGLAFNADIFGGIIHCVPFFFYFFQLLPAGISYTSLYPSTKLLGRVFMKGIQ